jgi:hypothetical protein
VNDAHLFELFVDQLLVTHGEDRAYRIADALERF